RYLAEAIAAAKDASDFHEQARLAKGQKLEFKNLASRLRNEARGCDAETDRYDAKAAQAAKDADDLAEEVDAAEYVLATAEEQWRAWYEDWRAGGQERRAGGKERRAGGQERRAGGQERRAGGQERRAGGKERRAGGERLPDYYATLGVEPGASNDEIRVAYRTAMRQHHPDKVQQAGGDEKAVEAAKVKTQQINAAWQVLSDERKRAEYDRLRQRSRGFGGNSGVVLGSSSVGSDVISAETFADDEGAERAFLGEFFP
ncbi:J domain-containing protein, partial [Saccharopolyspora thermophila]|uniref:J domain-containing protein n=1 Tax=Saccharopolyspora thermophila TaxID=89367 RepID=UPI001669D2AA